MDFDEIVIYEQNFIGTPTDCVHREMLSSNDDELYKKMFNSFNSSYQDALIYRIADLPGADWGKTYGDVDNNNGIVDFYRININEDIGESSNLSKKVTLIHELIHAYLFDSLHEAGILEFLEDGSPQINTECFGIDYNNVNLTTSERYQVLICAMNQNNLPNNLEWSHEIFNTFSFSTSTYQEELKNFLFNNHNWDSESSVLIVSFQERWEDNWRVKAAEFLSWKGLEGIAEFQDYA